MATDYIKSAQGRFRFACLLALILFRSLFSVIDILILHDAYVVVAMSNSPS